MMRQPFRWRVGVSLRRNRGLRAAGKTRWKIRCLARGWSRILIYMRHSSSNINRESWKQPRYAFMRLLGDSLIREASG